MKSAPKLYIANGKHMAEVLQYRDPKTNQLRTQRIGAGRQVEIAGNYSVDELHQIVRQLEQYHDEVKTVAELQHVRNPKGLIFCLDAPIEADVIQERITKETELAQEIAAQESENAGLAAFAGAKAATGDVNETTLEVIQQDEQGRPARGRAVDFAVNVSKRNSGRQEGHRRSA